MRKLLSLIGCTAIVASCAGPGRVPARVQLTVAPLGVTAAALESDDNASPPGDVGTPPCAGEDSYCTASNLSGRIYKAVAMWGELGPGARSITLLDGTSGHLDNNDYFGGALPFSLIDGEIVTSSYEEVEDGGSRPVPRLEFYYDYLDATVALSGPLAGDAASATWMVRTVFVTSAEADDVTGTMLRGDKLVRGPGDAAWRWCNAQGCSPDRDAVSDGLVVEDKLVNHVYPGNGPKAYIPFAVPLDPPLSLSSAEINTPGSLWSCAFDMVDAVRMNAAPGTVNSPQALLAAFELAYDPDQQHAGSEVRISAHLAFTRGEDPVAVADDVPAACVTACARVASCYGFQDGLFGASEQECSAGCGEQDDATVGQISACLSASDCADRDAIASCMPTDPQQP